jgi:signal transduction histidine kinase
MLIKRRLRYRVAAVFAVFGGLVSVIQAFGVYVASQNLEEHLIDDTLTAELEDFADRRARNPRSLPEMTTTIRAYAMPIQGNANVPTKVAELEPGRHQLELEGTLYRAAVAVHGAERFAVLFNETQLSEREKQLLALLIGGVFVMTCLSAVAGFWVSGRVIAPVTDLVRRVANLRLQDKPESLAQYYPWDEIRELAQDFDEYLIRLNAFIERERAFTADVSHELRTPLAVVNGAAEVLLTDPKLPETSRHRVARMARAAEEMSEITAALLVLAREEGTQISRSVSCDVENVLQEVVDKLREPLQAKPIDMKLEIEAKPSLAVERAVLAMVIGNLLRNAFAYTDRGEIRVHLDSQSLTVTDTGIGIEAEKLPRVFERYFSSNNGSSNNGSSHNSRGTGIGLSLVKRICDRYGWSITIDSKQGHGTTTKLAF